MSPGFNLDRLEEMQRLERCFMTPKGEIDLMEMSERLPEKAFREYCAMAREWRARRPKIGRRPQPAAASSAGS
jgi:hypothetical protein